MRAYIYSQRIISQQFDINMSLFVWSNLLVTTLSDLNLSINIIEQGAVKERLHTLSRSYTERVYKEPPMIFRYSKNIETQFWLILLACYLYLDNLNLTLCNHEIQSTSKQRTQSLKLWPSSLSKSWFQLSSQIVVKLVASPSDRHPSDAYSDGWTSV